MVVVARRQRGNALERGRCGLLPLVRQGPRLGVSTFDSHEDPNRAGFSCEDLFFLPCFFAICIDSHPRHPGLTFLADRHARRSPQHRCERQGCVWVREPPTIMASWYVFGVIHSSWTYQLAKRQRYIHTAASGMHVKPIGTEPTICSRTVVVCTCVPPCGERSPAHVS
jgi:hypothetical protein